jgi:hypothetical protein
MTENTKGSESECLHSCAVTSHVGVMEITQQFLYRELEFLYTSAVTRHVGVNGVTWQFAYILSWFTQMHHR